MKYKTIKQHRDIFFFPSGEHIQTQKIRINVISSYSVTSVSHAVSHPLFRFLQHKLIPLNLTHKRTPHPPTPQKNLHFKRSLNKVSRISWHFGAERARHKASANLGDGKEGTWVWQGLSPSISLPLTLIPLGDEQRRGQRRAERNMAACKYQ